MFKHLGSILTVVLALCTLVFMGALLAVSALLGSFISVVGTFLTVLVVLIHGFWEYLKANKQ